MPDNNDITWIRYAIVNRKWRLYVLHYWYRCFWVLSWFLLVFTASPEKTLPQKFCFWTRNDLPLLNWKITVQRFSKKEISKSCFLVRKYFTACIHIEFLELQLLHIWFSIVLSIGFFLAIAFNDCVVRFITRLRKKRDRLMNRIE